jgi:hypothetical protein
VIAGAIVGVAIVVLVAIVAAIAMTDSDGVVADPDSPPTTARPGPTTSEPADPGATTTTSPPVDLDAAIDEAIAFVEAERERTFTTRPLVEALDDAAFVARYDQLVDEAIAEDPHAVEAATITYRAFGFIEPDQDAVSVERSFGAAGVLGFYDTEKNELVVRGAKVTPYFRTTLVHELTHALDDQLVELDRPEYDESDDEVSFGLSAVAEGNARRVERAYYESLSKEEQREADREEAGYANGIDIGDFSLSYLVLQYAPYELGQIFVDEILDSDGEDGVDEALRNPPTTSEQVVYVDSYRTREPRAEVPHPTPPGGIAPFEEGSLGLVPIMAMLSSALGSADAFSAADGWAGDWYVVWKDGDASCMRATIRMDDEDEADELRDGLESWADEQAGDPQVSSSGDTVDVGNCVR